MILIKDILTFLGLDYSDALLITLYFVVIGIIFQKSNKWVISSKKFFFFNFEKFYTMKVLWTNMNSNIFTPLHKHNFYIICICNLPPSQKFLEGVGGRGG